LYEFNNVKTIDFKLFTPESRFTNDTVLTIEVADCILNGKDYAITFKEYGRLYPDAGYGDFWFEGLDVGKYSLKIEAKGFTPKTIGSISTEKDVNLGDISLK